MDDNIYDAIESFKYLTGVGEKSAKRYVNDVLEMSEQQRTVFLNGINNLNSIQRCHICFNYSFEDTCNICKEERDTNKLFIVSYPNEINIIDNVFENKYAFHVLGGVIDPLKGKNVEDLSFDLLSKRINNFEEIIIALPTTTQGELTANYIIETYGKEIKITKIAQGIPNGGSLEYVDELTLYKAIEARE